MSFQQTPYLRNQRQFPNDNVKELANQTDHAYIDIATKVNERVIGIFATGFSLVTGEGWYLNGSSRKQQTLRQLYAFSGAGNIAHGINTSQISGFTRIYGTFTNGTNWYPLPYVDATAANNQVSVSVTPTNIVITAGGGRPSCHYKWMGGFRVVKSVLKLLLPKVTTFPLAAFFKGAF